MWAGAGSGFGFAEMAAYHAATKGDVQSMALLLSMGGIPSAKGDYSSTKELLDNGKKGLNSDLSKLRTDLANEAKKNVKEYKAAVDKINNAFKAAKEFRNRLKEQEKGDGAHEDLKALIAERRKVATDFYKKYYPDMPDWKLDSHLSGIDFTKPVKVVELPKGKQLFQYTRTNAEGLELKGDYYIDDPSIPPNKVGVAADYNVPDPQRNLTNEVKTREQKEIILDHPMEGLESTAAPIEDTWSRIDENGNSLPISTEGTGIQIYIPASQF